MQKGALKPCFRAFPSHMQHALCRATRKTLRPRPRSVQSIMGPKRSWKQKAEDLATQAAAIPLSRKDLRELDIYDLAVNTDAEARMDGEHITRLLSSSMLQDLTQDVCRARSLIHEPKAQARNPLIDCKAKGSSPLRSQQLLCDSATRKFVDQHD